MNMIKKIGFHRAFSFFIAVFMCLIHLYMVIVHIDRMVQCAIHVGLALILVFMLFPAKKIGPGSPKKSKNSWLEWLMIILSVVVFGYIIVCQEYIVNRMLYVTPIRVTDALFAGIAVILVLEAVRRTIGWSLVGVALLFIFYAAVGANLPGMFRHGGISLSNITDMVYLSTNGLFGSTTAVSATFIMLFIM